MKFMMAKPFEKIEQGDISNTTKLLDVKKKMHDEIQEQFDQMKE